MEKHIILILAQTIMQYLKTYFESTIGILTQQSHIYLYQMNNVSVQIQINQLDQIIHPITQIYFVCLYLIYLKHDGVH